MFVLLMPAHERPYLLPWTRSLGRTTLYTLALLASQAAL